MKNTSTLRHSLVLGASTVLLALGCGEGGAGTISQIDTPFNTPPTTDDRGGNPVSAGNPYKGSAPVGEDGYQSSADSGGYSAPSISGGGSQPPPGSGNCSTSLRQFYDRCGITEQLAQNPEVLAQLDSIVGQICAAIQTSPSCSACVFSKIPTISCSAVEEDVDDCEAACSGVDFDIEFDEGQGGSGGGGGAAGSSGEGGSAGSGPGGDLCGRCGDLAQCPEVGLSPGQCLEVCGSAPPGCAACVNAAGTDCNAIGACLASACSGGGEGGSGGSSSGGASCSQLGACCATLPAEAQSGCQSIASGGDDNTCGQVFSSYQNAGLCGGG